MTQPPQASLQPTRPTTLAIAAVVAAAAGYLFYRRFFGSAPDLSILPGLILLALAVVEVVLAWQTRAKIERRPGAGPLNALLVSRLVVLAKASSLGGAIFAGGYAGVAIWALSRRGTLTVAQQNLAPAIVGVIGSLALLAAALILERACRVPAPPEDPDQPDTSPGTDHDVR